MYTSNPASRAWRLLPPEKGDGCGARKASMDDLHDELKLLKLSQLCECSACESERLFTDEEKFYLSASVLGWCVLLATLLIFLFLLIPTSKAEAAEIKKEKAVLAIIGEAENQGYNGMLAVAGALRNRGTLKGVYGLHAPRVKARKYTAATYQLASKAWAESATHDITHGGTHWENVRAFGCPYWVKSCIKVFAYKDHVFYREV